LAAPMTPRQLAGLAGLARDLGNGVVEVTARGKLQIRGLTSSSAPRLAEGVDALGIEVRQGFPVEISALAGLDPQALCDPRALADAISHGAARLMGRLAPKVSVVVDGGGALHLGALAADIAVTAGGSITLAGAPFARVAEGEAAATVIALLEILAARGNAARMSELVSEQGVETLRAVLGLQSFDNASECPPAEPLGVHPLSDGTVALGIGLTFGQSEAGALETLARIAEALDVAHVEPAAGRALLLVGLAPASAAELRVEASTLGFITDPADPRRLVSACPGAPSCGSGRMETRVLAAEIATLAKGRSVHVSGCAKGCAHPGPAALTIVGLDEGAGIVVEGTPRDTPSRLVSIADLRAALRDMFEKIGA
ncbi:MAG TPA: precorrin-3B synthase, partial [Ancylobacter sp.]